MSISTSEVIEAASTKWNFMKLHPGLVGGHCISVDPYYLLHKSGDIGFIPDLIRKSREINDGMSYYIAVDFLKFLVSRSIDIRNTKIIILGFSFKPNCPDTRNTKIFDLYAHLTKIGLQCEIYDPIVDHEDVRQAYAVNLVNKVQPINSVALLAVEHEQFNEEFLEQFTHVYGITK
jgi:UDP-N-acetyl-D-galactosamine dehydrogenase